MTNFKDLPSFLKHLEQTDQLKRISHTVSTNLELTEISRRVLAQGGPALLFENVTRHDGSKSPYPVLTNLFGTIERVAAGLGTTKEGLRELGRLLAFLRQPEAPGSFKEMAGMLPLLKKVMAMKPKVVKSAPCQEVVIKGDDIDINDLPLQLCWPGDVSPLITWPLVVTKGPSLEKVDDYNLGIYRMQPIGKDRLLMRWLKMRGGAEHHRRSLASGRVSFPAAAVIGADPCTILSAVMPLPENVSEYQFSGLLGGEKLELVKCKTIDLLVPAHAEIVIEGEVSFTDYRPEGPFGDHTGYYNDVEEFPVFRITAITRKKKPVYLTTYTGRPPDEPSVLGEALNELFIPLVQQQFPEIVDFWLPPEGCSYRFAVISIKKSYAGQARRIMMGAWSFLKQFMYTKYVIIVDEDINVRDWKEVVWAIATRSDPTRDTMMIDNTPIDYLDFASPKSGIGSKMGIDATNKVASETDRNWGQKIEMDKAVVEKIDLVWKELGL
jgi:4-hydroxy-3-polyprenylbenzoate decarboxylase